MKFCLLPNKLDASYRAYQNGYLSGYRNGYSDGIRGKAYVWDEGICESKIPIEAMGLSTRAYNCLRLSDCKTIADVAQMTQQQILQVRNLGKVTANEIARSLLECGIPGTDWEACL